MPGGISKYTLSSTKVILGDLENKEAIDTFILLDKVYMYKANTVSKLSSLFFVRDIVERANIHKKLKARTNDKVGKFEKEYGTHYLEVML